jgi:hypothetical protein
MKLLIYVRGKIASIRFSRTTDTHLFQSLRVEE